MFTATNKGPKWHTPKITNSLLIKTKNRDGKWSSLLRIYDCNASTFQTLLAAQHRFIELSFWLVFERGYAFSSNVYHSKETLIGNDCSVFGCVHVLRTVTHTCRERLRPRCLSLTRW